MIKYSIVSYLFNNYEKLREVEEVSNNCEYILITDNPNIKSKTWKIIYNPKKLENFNNPFDKCFYIRYHVFEFCNTEIAITIDHSMLIKKSLDKLIKDFINSNAKIGIAADLTTGNLGVKNNINWFMKNRNYSKYSGNAQLNFLEKIKYNKKGAIEAGLIIRKKSKEIFNLDNTVWKCLFFTGENGHVDRLDQTILSIFVFNLNINEVFIYDRHIWNSTYIQLCKHNSNEPFPKIEALKFKNKVYFNDYLVEPYYIE